MLTYIKSKNNEDDSAKNIFFTTISVNNASFIINLQINIQTIINKINK